MDTRFWGPAGWRLLHLIAASPIKHKKEVREWFELLEYVLPCKYCRASFHDYMELQPLTDRIIQNPELFGKWVYDIHNRVNAKLRGQGLMTTVDPTWSAVRAEYRQRSIGLCKTTPLVGWEFLVSIAYTTPGRTDKAVQMPDTPEYVSPDATMGFRNRYNLLDRQERIELLRQWWNLIPSILPCEAWRSSWSSDSVPPLAQGREAVMQWMWRVEERVCAGLQCPTPHPSLVALKKVAAAYKSDCSKRKRGKTCRAKRTGVKRTRAKRTGVKRTGVKRKETRRKSQTV